MQAAGCTRHKKMWITKERTVSTAREGQEEGNDGDTDDKRTKKVKKKCVFRRKAYGRRSEMRIDER